MLHQPTSPTKQKMQQMIKCGYLEPSSENVRSVAPVSVSWKLLPRPLNGTHDAVAVVSPTTVSVTMIATVHHPPFPSSPFPLSLLVLLSLWARPNHSLHYHRRHVDFARALQNQSHGAPLVGYCWHHDHCLARWKCWVCRQDS